MHRPKIANMSSTERQELIANIKTDPTDFPHKSITVETLNFCDELIESLRTAKITNLSELKKVLEIRSEQIKKLMQNQ